MSKKEQRVDLEKVAAQLASAKIHTVFEGEHLALKATATFATKSFVAGKYKVAVGLRQALLHLDHPSFELENAYQATLAKETWSQSWKNLKASQAAGSVKASVGAKLLGFFGLEAKGEVGKDHRESAEQQANAPYRIVTATPTGWQIGTELGDPRTPDGALPEGLEHCLSGEYLSGRHEEQGDGYKDKNGAFALGVLRAKPGGNDPRIVATLFGAAGSLRVVITPSEPPSGAQSALQPHSATKEQEEALRKAFVEICLQRAEAAHREGVRTDAMLTGELYLSHREIHALKVPPKVASDMPTKTTTDRIEQDVPAEPKT